MDHIRNEDHLGVNGTPQEEHSTPQYLKGQPCEKACNLEGPVQEAVHPEAITQQYDLDSIFLKGECGITRCNVRGLLGVLRRCPFEEAACCYGQWVLAEAQGCPMTVGVLRMAQSSRKLKVLTKHGCVIFFPRADTFLTTFEPNSPKTADAAQHALVLFRYRWWLLAADVSVVPCPHLVVHMLPLTDLLAMSVANLAWLGTVRGCIHDSAVSHRAPLIGQCPPASWIAMLEKL